MLHIRDVEGPKKTGSVETRLEAMEQQVFKCQGMVERGLNANHMMITEFTNKHRIDANDIGKHLSRLYDRLINSRARSMTCRTKTVRFVGVDRVKAAWLAMLRGEFDHLQMDNGDDLDAYAGKFYGMSARYTGLEAVLNDATMVKKLLDTVLDRLYAGIEQFCHVDAMSLEEALGRHKAFDEP
ncbi:retrotransposon protein [Hordeum vulgare]|nr:retrotransposon protein [Hordeum vulgare]